jgi:hypothetical protein
LNCTEDGEGVSVAVTVKVTGTLSCPLALPHVPVVQVKTTLPWYTPVARPLATPVLIDTVSLPGVAPLPEDICSQLPPLTSEAVAVYEMAAPELLIPSEVLGVEPGV